LEVGAILVEYFCSKDFRKLVLMAFQLSLSMLKVSKLSDQDWAGPWRILASSQTLQQSSQVPMFAAASILSMSQHPMVVWRQISRLLQLVVGSQGTLKFCQVQGVGHFVVCAWFSICLFCIVGLLQELQLLVTVGSIG
jgi:hypothetical protein